ncbi:MAG TPA: aminodeoxychorismate synthase component I [Longimicrobiales bacterium]|nr:aminodeoxychorismate synthase component I [Longimicrobiales bacterium]
MRLVFDFPDDAGRPRRRVFSRPVGHVVARTIDEVRPALDAVRDAATNGLYAAGYVSYEAAPAFDRAMRVRGGHRLPLVRFGLFDRSTDPLADQNHEAPHVPPTLDWTADTGRDAYDAAIARIRDAIGRGDTYQVNYTFRLHAWFEGDVGSWYEALRAAQGGGYTADLDFGDTRILTASPELFFERRADRVTSRPMKGTRRRGRWADEDRALADQLAASGKDRAENLMIVDLTRNDLGRVARIGTVDVPAMFAIERYRTVWQMTSTITAQVRDDVTLTDLFAALFPCGSVTGAPKIATTHFIADIETSPREVYCGAIGVVEPGGDCTFNVPIRTVWIDVASNTAEYGIGSGITWDSSAEAEYDECLDKAALLSERWHDFELLETMRMDDGRIPRIERHLSRLRASADYFGFPFDERRVRDSLQLPGAGPLRLRLRLAKDGNVNVDRGPDAPPVEPVRVAFASRAVSSRDRFLHHKTTAREEYDSRLAERPDVFDVLLVNEHGFVTEFTRGNVVIESGGHRLTPARAVGLLAGTFRAELLDSSEIGESDLRPDDVRRADRIWFINSVRGWLRAELVDGTDEPPADRGRTPPAAS